MLDSTRHQALLAAIAGALFFVNLGAAHLWDVDEAIFAETAREMLERGDEVVPYFNGEVFTHKPALMYWTMTGAYRVFGTTEFAARFPSALFGIATVLVTYRLGRLMFSPRVAFWSGLVLATNLNFNVIARAATPDSLLTFFTALALLAFVAGTAKARVLSGEANERNAPWAGQTRFEPSWFAWSLTYAAMGGGVLTKGPVGVVLPTAIIGLFLLVMRAEPIAVSNRPGWRGAASNLLGRAGRVFAAGHFFRTVWSMRPLTALAMVLAVAGPWYVWVGIETEGLWPRGFFGVHNFGRFLHAMENHRGPIFYYVIAIAPGFFPWSVLFGPMLTSLKGQLAESPGWRPGYVLVGAWFAVWVGFFSLAGTKLPSYVVPAYPALALATGCFVASWLRVPALLPRFWTRLAWGTVALSGIGMMVAFPIAAHLLLDDDWMLGAIGLVPLAAALVGCVSSERRNVRGSVATLAALGAALSLALFGLGAARVDRYQDSPPFAESIAARTPAGQTPAIGAFYHFRPSFVFYTGQTIERIATADDVQRFFAAHPLHAFVVTNDERIEQLRPLLPADVTVLDSRRRFLRPGQALLLGRAQAGLSTAAQAPADSKPARH